MKKMKAMYRKHTILARNISIAVFSNSVLRRTVASSVRACPCAELQRWTCSARRWAVGIKLATEVVALQFAFVACPGSKIAGLLSAAVYERWKKNPHCFLPARCRRCGAIYVAADPTGGAARYYRIRFRRLVDCSSGGLSSRCPGVPRRDRLVVTFSEIRAIAAAATVLDALDWRVSKHTRAFRYCWRRCR